MEKLHGDGPGFRASHGHAHTAGKHHIFHFILWQTSSMKIDPVSKGAG